MARCVPCRFIFERNIHAHITHIRLTAVFYTGLRGKTLVPQRTFVYNDVKQERKV